VRLLSLILSLSRPSQNVGDAEDIMQGEPDAGDRGLGSLTSFLVLGCFRATPYTFLIRSPMPLAHDMPGADAVEP
jgi:hypothetical protein